jgi:putative membrane protein
LPDRSWEFWLTGWNFEPTIVAGLAIFYGAYLLVTGPWRSHFSTSRRISSAQLAAFSSGILVLIIALLSPLDALADHFWLNAHMAQHLLLTLIAPPLLLMGTPGWIFDPMQPRRALLNLGRALTNPYVGFLSFNIVFALWHLPAWYDRALESEPIHIFEHLTFMATAVLTWWPVLSPSPLLPRISLPAQSLYLFLQSIPATGLGAVITFAAKPIYLFYASAPRVWGLSLPEDQTWAGLIMWIGGALIFLFALTVRFFEWFNQEEPVPGREFI